MILEPTTCANILETFIQECLKEKNKLISSTPIHSLIIKSQYALTQSSPISAHTRKILNGLLSDSNKPMKVAIIGQFSSGKSTFLNALLGSEILPSGITPVTAKVCEITYGDEISLEIRYKNGQVINKHVEYLKQVDSIENTKIDFYRLFVPLDLLREVTFLDTPGFNSQNQSDTDTTNALLEEVDGIIWLSLIDNVGKNSEKDILQKYLQKYASKSLCVLNQKDRLKDDNEVATSLEYAKKAFSGFFEDIIPISAKQAIDSMQLESNSNEALALLKDSNIKAVLDFIDIHIKPQAIYAKEYRILRSLRTLLIMEKKRIHRSNQSFASLDSMLGIYIEQVRFAALQSGLEKIFQTLFVSLESSLSSLAQEIFNSFELKEITIVRDTKSKLGFKKEIRQTKNISFLPKEKLLSYLCNEENDFARRFKKLGFEIVEFGSLFKAFVESQTKELYMQIEEWRTKSLRLFQFDCSDDGNDLAIGKMVLDRRFWIETLECEIFHDYDKNALRCVHFMQDELQFLQNILNIDFNNMINLTLEKLNFEVENALNKHRSAPDSLPLYNPTLENVRILINSGIHYAILQDKLSLNFPLYKKALWNLSEELTKLHQDKKVLLQSWIKSNNDKFKILQDCDNDILSYLQSIS
ncbi:GTP-binding protein [Helicobacter muridarum]|uniref:GTP-binding protein n=1 Tax=Helicobacter muridarum TaxID=216 RepID=A0A099TYX3_9HELI|nr:dynamin family protein [Helicobacter muridarum]TLE00172.1 GTP-binding protein [Helicobacter muridarum]STQ87020.1 putative ATP/GTP binding protein [Helicobacter muridarum]